jgi:hypothetical protein
MNGQPQTISNNSVFILGAIINTLAVVDMNGLIDYSVKAIVGGCIWLAFKILADFVSTKMNRKNLPMKREEEGFKTSKP